jgi:hypothetical protein
MDPPWLGILGGGHPRGPQSHLLFSAFNVWAVLLSMVIPAVILIYFFADSHVREAFNIG